MSRFSNSCFLIFYFIFYFKSLIVYVGFIYFLFYIQLLLFSTLFFSCISNSFCHLLSISFSQSQIFFNFHLAFVDNAGDVITDHRSLVMKYVKGKFPFDLAANFPIDIFALAAPAGRKLEVLSFLRLLHLLRLVRMEQFFTEYGKKLDIE